MNGLRGIGSAVALLCAAAVAPPAFAATDAHVETECELHVRVTPRYDTRPRGLDVSLSFPAAGRSQTYLRMTRQWAGVDGFVSALGGWRGSAPTTTVEPAETPERVRVAHAASGRVSVEFHAQASLPEPDSDLPQDHAEAFRTQVGGDWFQFFGYSVLPSVEPWGDDVRTSTCVTVLQPGLADAPVLGSHFADRGLSVMRRFSGSPALLRHAFYAGGRGWRVYPRQLPSGTVHVALRGRHAEEDRAYVDKTVALVGTHRSFWGERSSPPQTIVFTPNRMRFDSGGTVVEKTAVLQTYDGFTSGSERFEFLIGHENLHQWIPQRLGSRPVRGDPTTYWFSEGITDYYAHRLSLGSGLWQPRQYAEALTRAARGYWRSPARNATSESIAPRFFSDTDAGRQMYSRGELLAMRWDLALRAAGSPQGLDAVLRGLILPRSEDAAAAPLATERLFAALAPLLGDAPRLDVKRHVDEGATLDLPADLAGPCFAITWADAPRWVPGFDRALSFASRKAVGVVIDGPAHRAELREGMDLVGWSVFDGDTERDVVLMVRSESGPLTMRFRPADGSTERLPEFVSRPGSEADAACALWLR